MQDIDINNNREFPVELLDDTIENRCDFFKRITVYHEKFLAVGKQLVEHIMARDGKPLMFLIGPSQVGKTTLLTLLMEMLTAIHLKMRDRGRIPYGYAPCIASGGRCNWKDTYRRWLQSFNAPLIEKIKALPHKALIGAKGESKSTTVMHNALEETMKWRKPFVLILDEGGHLKRVPVGMTLKDQLDTLKSLAELTSCKILVVGTPELMDLRDLSPQLMLRNQDFYFHRYLPNDDDWKAYKNALFTFQENCPVRIVPNLMAFSPKIMELTCGSIGLTHSLLLRALRLSIEDKAETITARHIAQSALTKKRRDAFLKSVITFEAEAADDADERKEIEKELISLGNNNSPLIESSPNSENRTRNKPGIRNPSRDRDVIILR
jgi:hypothetical protein